MHRHILGGPLPDAAGLEGDGGVVKRPPHDERGVLDQLAVGADSQPHSAYQLPLPPRVSERSGGAFVVITYRYFVTYVRR